MIRLFSTFLLTLFFSCNDTFNEYEYINKDKVFVNEFNHTENSNIVQLSKGFTYYKSANKKTNTVPVVLGNSCFYPTW